MGRFNSISFLSLKLALFLFVSALVTITISETTDIGIGIGIGIGGGGGSNPNPPDCGCPEPDCGCPEPEPTPCPPPPPPAPQFENELLRAAYYVIQRFKKTITCDPNNVTKTWKNTNPCGYQGFFCGIPPSRNNTRNIASVDFNGFRLCAPTVSGFVDQLPDLALFHANSNNFSGSVPDLRKSQFLYELDLSNNKLLGPFPQTLLPLNNLLFLDIRFNFFAGSVPANIFILDLDVLFLNNNGFSQPLPGNLGSTTAAYLTLANNMFTGPIPSSICNASKTLLEVLFLNNRLSGCLPFEVGLLKEATVFDAGFNRITGPIPLSFGCLKKIEQLNLAGNLLYGCVPDVLCNLGKYGKLENLSLSDNYFTSVGYSCLELIKNKVLDVSKNCIVGFPNQRSPWDCACFFAKPKVCPFISFIPCDVQYHRGHGEEAEKELVPASAEKSPGPGSGSVTYKAVHKRHG